MQTRFYTISEQDMAQLENILPDYFNDNDNGGNVDGLARLVEVSHLTPQEQQSVNWPIVEGTRIERYTKKSLKNVPPEKWCAWPSSRIAYIASS